MGLHHSNFIILKGMGRRIKRDLTAVAKDEERLVEIFQLNCFSKIFFFRREESIRNQMAMCRDTKERRRLTLK